MTDTHTPGPWWTYDGLGRGEPTCVGAESGNVAACERAADARLIKAAPDMLALLRWLNNKGGLGLDVHDRICETIVKAGVRDV